MRKFTILFLAIVAINLNAQIIDFSTTDNTETPNLTSKKGHFILPEKGDIALGIDALPVLDFIGNLVKINNGGTFTSPLAFDFADGATIFVKYYTGNSTAIRSRFNIAWFTDVSKTDVTDGTTPDAYTDKITESYWGITGSLGLEKRRGETRLQGFYGAEGMVILNRGGIDTDGTPLTNDKYTYESPLAAGARITTNKQPIEYGIGAGIFGGIEYFILPKISIGGEFNISLVLQDQGKSIIEIEDATGTITETKTSNGGSYGITTGNSGGTLYFLFHF